MAIEQITLGSTTVGRTGFGVNLSLLKGGTISQTIVGFVISAMVVASVIVTVIMVSVSAGLSSPKAKDDYLQVYKHRAYIIYPLLNDYDPKSLNLTIVNVTQPAHGSAVLSDGGKVTFTSKGVFSGNDSFVYSVSNGYLTSSAVVYIEILNRPPELLNLQFTVSKNSEKNALDVFNYYSDTGGKISDPDNDELSLAGIGEPAIVGSTVKYDSNYVYYTPPRGFNNQDKFTYSITDGNATVSAMITINVLNDAPVANPDSYTVPKNAKTILKILENDYDVNGDNITIVPRSAGLGSIGTVTVSADYQYVTYIPPPKVTPENDAFEYSITDGALQASTFAFVKLVNTPPNGKDRTFDVPKNSVNNQLDLTYTDEDIMDTVTVSLLSKPVRGSFQLLEQSTLTQVNYPTQDFYTVKLNSYTMVYTPESGVIYTESFQVKISDGIDFVTSTISIRVVPTAPIAVNDTTLCDKNSNVTLNVVANDYSLSKDDLKLNFTQFTTVQGGSIKKVNDNSIVYIPAHDFTGTDYAPYEVINTNKDGSTAGIFSSTGYVIVSVTNTAPVARDDVFTVSKGLVGSFNLIQNDFDPNGDSIKYSDATKSVQGVTVTMSPTDSLVTYASLNQVYIDTFTYTVSDVEGSLSNYATVTVNVINNAPVAVNDVATVAWNRSVTIEVLANDQDINPGDLNNLVIKSLSTPSAGTVTSFEGGKKVLYTPPNGFTGVATFTYTTTDGLDVSNAATVTVTVTNSAPVAAADSASVHWLDGVVVIPVLSNDQDADGDALFVQSFTQPSKGVVARVTLADGKDGLSYTSTSSNKYSGPDSFTYTVSDNGKSAVGTVSITVTDDAPTAAADSYTFHWRSSNNVLNVLSNDADQNNDPITILSVTKPTGFSGAVDKDGASKNLVFSPTSASIGTQQVTYITTDSVLSSQPAAVTLIVTNKDVPSPKVISKSVHWKTSSTKVDIFSAPQPLDADGDSLSVITTPSIAPTKGSVVVSNGDNTTIANAVYQQQANYLGDDSFNLTITDSANTAQVKVNINVYDNAPTASAASETKHFDVVLNGYTRDVVALCNAVDSDQADTVSVKSVSVASGGSVSFSGNMVTFVGEKGFVGASVITITFTDGLLTTTATWTITIQNVAPVAVPFSTNIQWTQTNTLIDVMSVITDADSDEITYFITSSSNVYGTPTTSGTGSSKKVKWTLPGTVTLGTSSFTIQFTDGWVNRTASFDVVIKNTAPVATNKVVTSHWSIYLGGVSIDVLAGCTDADSDSLSLASTPFPTQPTHGTVSLNTGKALYKPTQGYVGDDSFTYAVTDGLTTTTATVTVHVVDKLPISNNDAATVHWASGNIIIDVLSNDSDEDSDVLSVDASSISSPAQGTTAISGTTKIKYTLAGTPTKGPQTFTYKANDGAKSSTTAATVTVTITNNNVPSVSPQSQNVHWRTAASGFNYNIYNTPNDADGDTYALSVSGSACSVVTSGSVKAIKYLHADYQGTETCTATLSDGLDSASNTLTTTSYDNAPVAAALTVQYYGSNVQTGIEIDAIASATDADVEDLSFLTITAVGASQFYGSSAVTIVSNKIKYFPTPALVTAIGTDSFTYTISDGLRTHQATITVQIKSFAPSESEQLYEVHWRTGLNSGVTLNPLSKITNPDTLTLSPTLIENPDKQGTVVVSGDLKTINYKPAAYFVGTEHFVLKYFTQSGQSTIDMTITVYDKAPTATAITKSTHWKTAVPITMTSSVNDPDTTDVPFLLTYTGTAPSSGTFTIVNNAGTYTPSSTIGVVSMNYIVSDGLKNASSTVTVTVTNTPPTSAAKSKTVLWRTFRDGFDLDVLALSPADSDANGDALSIKSVTNPLIIGTATKKTSSVVTLAAPGSTFTGPTSFTYVVTDGASNGDVTTKVNLNIYNTAPVASDDFVSVHWNTASLTIDVLANDIDADSDSLTITSVYGSLASTAPIVSAGKIIYYPISAPLGNDTLTYVISDGVTTSTGKIYILVTNTKPTTQNVVSTYAWSAAVSGVTVTVIANSADANSDTLTLTSYSAIPASQGTLALVDSGKSIKYTPLAGFVGTINTISFIVSDGRETVTGTISITITNTAPTAVVTAFSYHWRAVTDATATINLGSRLSDANGDTVTITAITKTNQATVTMGASNNVNYKLASAWKGTDTFTVSFTDGWTSASATFTVIVTNAVPAAFNIPITVHFSNAYSLSIPVVGRSDSYKPTDADTADSTLLTVNSFTNPNLGTVTLSADKKTFTFVNPTGNLVTSSFTYTVFDGLDSSSTQTITITLQNAAPTSSDKVLSYHWANAQTGFDINLLTGAADTDGDALSVTFYSQPSVGTLTQGATGIVKYTPPANTALTTSFQFKISDGAQTITQTVSITITNTAPVAVADSYTNNWRSKTLTLPLLANDVDANGDSITISSIDSVSSSRSATLTLSADKKSVTYKDTTSLGAGTDTFKYAITDSVATSAAVTVTLTFTNTAPVAAAVSTTMKWSETKLFSDMLSTKCSDADSDPLTFTGVVQGTLGTTVVSDSVAGTFTYKPSSSITYTTTPTDGSAYKATDTVKYGCTDGVLSALGTISIEITNTPPKGTAKTSDITRNYANPSTTLSGLLVGASDADGDTVRVSSVALLPGSDAGTSIVLNADGTVKFAYSNAFIGTQQFYVYLTDGQLTSSYVYTVNIIGSALNCIDYTVSASKNDVSVQFEDGLRLALVKVSGSEPATISLVSTTSLSGVGTMAKDTATAKLTYTPVRTRSCINGNCFATYSYSNTAGQTVTCKLIVDQPNQAPVAPNYAHIYSVSRGSNAAQVIDYLLLSNAADPDNADTLSLTSIASVGTCDSSKVQSITISSNKINFLRQLTFAGSSCSFTVNVADSDPNNQKTVVATITVTPTASPPIAVNDLLTTRFNTFIDIPVTTLLANDYDSLGGTFSFGAISCPTGSCTSGVPTILNPSDPANTRIIRVLPVTGSCDAIQFTYSIVSNQDATTSTAVVTIQYTSCQCSLNLDIVFVLDGSGSITAENWVNMQRFAANVTTGFGSNISPTGTRIGIVQFASSLVTHLTLSQGTSTTAVLNAISGAYQIGSGTNSISGVNLAIDQMVAEGRESITNKILIFISDGESNEPCSCSGCNNLFSATPSRYGNVPTYCKSPRFPGMSCSSCSWNAATSRCNPCADTTVRSKDLNSWVPGNAKNAEFSRFSAGLWNWKQLAIGIGAGLSSALGKVQIQRMNYDDSNTIMVDWSNLSGVYQTVVDNSCNTVGSSQTKTRVPLSDSGFTITYQGKTTAAYKTILSTNWVRSTFSYNVAVASNAASGVEKFTLKLASGYNQDAFTTYYPYFPVYLGKESISGYTGFTWESTPGTLTVAKGNSLTYTLTVEGDVSEDTIDMAISGGSQFAVSTIKGPSSVVSLYNPLPPAYVETASYRTTACSATLGRCYVYTKFVAAYSKTVMAAMCTYWKPNAKLVMIQSAAEKTIVMGLLPKSESVNFFLGMNYDRNSKVGTWEDGTALSFTDWQTNHPSSNALALAGYSYSSPNNKWWYNAASSTTTSSLVCWAPFE